MFTDTIEEINGRRGGFAAAGRVFRDAGLAVHHDLVRQRARQQAEHETFKALDRFSFDVYEEFALSVPPVLQMLRWCEDNHVDVIHAATPGPVGMIAVLLARTLGLPLVASYHTDLPRLGYFLTSDHIVRESLWTFVRGFYNQAEIVFCPSRAVQDDSRGTVSEPARELGPGHRRHQVHAGPTQRRRAARAGQRQEVLLWVGRMSPEKGLDFSGAGLQPAAPRARRRAARTGRRRALPRAARRAAAGGVVPGYRTGDELATIYGRPTCSSFPAGRDVRQVLLEAAASGLPAVVIAGTGVDENVAPNETALVVPPGDARGFAGALERLLDDEPLRQTMGLAARDRALQRSWPATFSHMRDVYRSMPA